MGDVGVLSQLSDTADTLELWIKVQLLWQSLESVFTGGDIMKQMSLEAKKFQGIRERPIPLKPLGSRQLQNILQTYEGGLMMDL